MNQKQESVIPAFIKTFQFPDWSVPLLLLVISILGFGLLIPWLGFFWDDWPSIWFLHMFGPTGFGDVFASDRPFLGFLFNLTTSIFGESILNWQLFSLITHWLAGVSLWWVLRLLWPQQGRQTAWIAILFTIYPGFSQQSISVTYSHAWVILAFFFTSLGLMILAIRKPRWFWPVMGASLLCSTFAMFSTEYFFTLELLRPVFIWIALADFENKHTRRFKKMLLYWLPFLILMLAFLIWRFFIHEFPRAELINANQIASNPLSSASLLVKTILVDIFESGLLAWYIPFRYFANLNLSSRTYLIILMAAILAAFLVIIYLARYYPVNKDNERTGLFQSWAFQAALLGLYALFISGWPFWMTDLLIKLDFPNDRFTLPMMLGSCVLIIGLIELIPRAFYPKIAIIATLTGVAVGMHLNYANSYRLEWAAQKDFFWQLSWRMPQIKSGTTVMAAHLPFRYFSDNSLTAPLNWIYAPENTSDKMSYLIYDIQSRRGNNPNKFRSDELIHQPYRATEFNGTTSQALVLNYAPPGCVMILDLPYDQDNPDIPRQTLEAIHLSDRDNILVQEMPALLPEHIFGIEPDHEWCYFVQQVYLARQKGDWQTAAKQADSAFALNPTLYPINATELVGFIEAYAYTGQWDRAQDISLLANNLARKTSLEDDSLYPLKKMLCNLWSIIQDHTSSSPQRNQVIDTVESELKCDQP